MLRSDNGATSPTRPRSQAELGARLDEEVTLPTLGNTTLCELGIGKPSQMVQI